MEVAAKPREVKCFHGMFLETDQEASTPATIDLLSMFVAFVKPKTVVEAGTYKGHFCCAAANIIRLLGNEGHVYTSDVDDHGLTHLLRDDPQGPLIEPYITFHNGDYLEMLETVPGAVDFAYIDASCKTDPHTRLNHATATYERLAPGGLIFVDDTASKDWPDARVFRWTSNIYLSPHRGLSIIQKPL